MHDIRINQKSMGSLFVVATPIGNMEDITFRAVRILSSVDFIIVENANITKRLLNYHGIETKIISMNEHNEKKQIPIILNKIKSNLNLALVSDAGTPLISDPGFRLIKEAICNCVNIVPIPGVSAIISSISVAGLPTNAFAFLGFPFKKKGKRIEQLSKLISEKKTLIFYESPRRIIRLLEELIQVLGDRYVVLSREMTKIHEEFIRGNASHVLATLKTRDKVKGECTLLISGALSDLQFFSKENIEDIIRDHLNLGFATLELSKLISNQYGLTKSKAYDIILKVKKNNLQ